MWKVPKSNLLLGLTSSLKLTLEQLESENIWHFFPNK